MKKGLSFLLTLTACFCFFIISGGYFSTQARTKKTLTVRTQLRPVNKSPAAVLWFAPGDYWVDDYDGGVQSGKLDQTAELKIWNTSRSLTFGPGFIRFEAAGDVKEGTLVDDTSLCVVNTASSSKFSLTFTGKTAVEFGYDGCVMKGTIAKEETLKSWDGKLTTYPPGTLVEWNGAGLVIRAVQPSGTSSSLDGTYTGSFTLSCACNSPQCKAPIAKNAACPGVDTLTDPVPFVFTAKGGSFNGGKDAKEYSLQWQGNYDASGAIKNGTMTGWIDGCDKSNEKLRWTITGPITGTLSAAGATGSLSIFTVPGPDDPPDRQFAKCTDISWSATFAPSGPFIPTVEGTKIDIKSGKGGCLDLIFVIDLTGSMGDDIDQVKKTALAILNTIKAAFPDFRVAIVGYRDWGDGANMFKDVPFSSSFDEITSAINSLSCGGGGDEPEAVLEGLLRALRMPWRNGCNKQIILMGDAPPHPKISQGPDAGKTAADVAKLAEEVDPAVINTILVSKSPGSFSDEAKKAFEDISARTKGTSTTADKAEDVPKRMMDMVETIKKTASATPVSTVGGGGPVLPAEGMSTALLVTIIILGAALILVAAIVVVARRGRVAEFEAGTEADPGVQAGLTVTYSDGGTKQFRIISLRTPIGRGEDNHLVLNDGEVSTHHAEIIASREGFCLRDLGGANGTTVNGQRVTEVYLRIGDVIGMGLTRLTFTE